jgi:hypothetical protein
MAPACATAGADVTATTARITMPAGVCETMDARETSMVSGNVLASPLSKSVAATVRAADGPGADDRNPGGEPVAVSARRVGPLGEIAEGVRIAALDGEELGNGHGSILARVEALVLVRRGQAERGLDAGKRRLHSRAVI